jgi:hypothetical protein
VYFVGDIIFSKVGGPLMDRVLNDYVTEIVLPTPFAGQDGAAKFVLDYRHTMSPEIHYGYIDMFIVGELAYIPHIGLDSTRHGSAGYDCTLEPDWTDFINSDTFSQIVISESAATCMAN